MSALGSVAIVGAGSIGSGWAALFAAHGSEVVIHDPDREALSRAMTDLSRARSIGVGAHDTGEIRLASSLEEAVHHAEWIQESVPELLALKRDVLARVLELAPRDAIIASSTSSYAASALGAGLPESSRLVIAHPLHPVYAMPVVELCASLTTASGVMSRAERVLRGLGRQPIIIRAEVPGLVSNRLTAALLREAFDLVARGVISAADLDILVARGIALGWAAAGPLRTEAIGAGGFNIFLEQMKEPLEELWRSLAKWESLDATRHAILASIAIDATQDFDWPQALNNLQRHGP